MLYLTNEDVSHLLTVDFCMQAIEDCIREQVLGRVLPQDAKTVSYPLTTDRVKFGGLEGPTSWFTLNSGGVVLDLVHRVAVLRVYSGSDAIVEMHGKYRRSNESPAERPSAEQFGNKNPDFLFLFDMDSLHLLCMMQNRNLQTTRVGALAGLSVKYMARQDAGTVGILGSGWIARSALAATRLVRDVKLVKVFSPNPEHRQQFAEKMSSRLEIQVEPVTSAKEAVTGSDIVISATDSAEPTFDPKWVAPGTHVHCIHGYEYDEPMLIKADVIAWGYPGARAHAMGARSHESGPEQESIVRRRRGLKWEQLEKYLHKQVYLTDVVTGKIPGRADDRQITLCPSPAGGTAGIAKFAILGPRLYEQAKAKGIGHELPEEWFQVTGEPD